MILADVNSVNKTSEIHNTKVVKDGSTVLVRVNKEIGNGKYEGFVGGVKINFSSKNPLKIGTSFVANITTKDGKILLTPRQSSLNSNQTVQKNSFLNSFLENMGVSPDNLAIHLLKQMKVLEMPLDQMNIRKTYSQVAKFKNKEKKVTDLLLLFQDKNIFLTEEEINKLLDFLDGDFEDSNSKELVNKLNSVSGAWYIFPFNLINNMENKILGNGIIKMFFDKLNNLNVLNINCNYNKNSFFFNLKYANKALVSMNYFINEIEDFTDVQKSLEKMFPDILITLQLPEDMDITGCDNEELYTINGEV